MAQQLFDVPMDEVQRGFLKGPYMSLEDIKSEFGLPQAVVNRRFLLLQGETNKPRAIDDCKTSSLNNAYTQTNKLILQDLDNYVALAALAGSSVRGNDVRVQVADGNLAVGQLHPDFQGVVSWQGKCLDLEKAYRQVPVSSDSLAYSVALVHSVEGKPYFFISQRLPFGACRKIFDSEAAQRCVDGFL